jgi:hypothetical protein
VGASARQGTSRVLIHTGRQSTTVPNPSIERTGPGKPGPAAHVER